MAAILLVLGATAAAQGAAARADLVTDLEKLAMWCAHHKLIGSRNQIYEAVLVLRPDHAEARKWLRYRIQGGEWVRAKGYRPPRDRNEDALPTFRAKRREVVDRFLARLKDAPLRVRQDGLRIAIAVAPDDAALRKAHDEMKVDGAWLLRESVVAKERRPELAQIARDLLKEVPEPKPVPITPAEKKLGIAWKDALQGEWWRFLGTTATAETKHALRVADATAPFLAEALPDPGRPISIPNLRRRGFGVYYLTNQAQGLALVKEHPGFSDAQRRFAQSVFAAWVPKTRQLINWYNERATRVESTARLALDFLMVMRYGEIDRGWMREGFGIYLGAKLTGTHLIWFVQPSDYARTDQDKDRERKLSQEMRAPKADWLKLARDLRAEKPPDLRFLTGKRLNQMTAEDLIHAHALAAYLIEGHPDRVSNFLAKYATNGHDLDAALGSELGLSFPDVETRLGRWLEETR